MSHSFLRSVVRATTLADDPHEAAVGLLRACADHVGAPKGHVYLIDLSRGSFAPIASRPEGESPPERDADGAEGIAIRAFRGETCIGMLGLEGIASDDVEAPKREELQAAVDLLVSIHEASFLRRLQQYDSTVLDFDQSEDDFLLEAAKLAQESSGMQFGALREVDGDRLRDVYAWGMDGPLDAEAMQSDVTLPIHAGEGIDYRLTLGAGCRFDFAPFEIHGFQAIAARLGHLLAGFRSVHGVTEEMVEHSTAARAMATVEIARSARHEAMNYLDSCNQTAYRLWDKLGEQAGRFEPELDALSRDLGRVGETLDRIRVELSPLENTLRRVTVQQVWSEAAAAIGARLADARVGAGISGPETEVEALPDLQYVFLNLILNSIDAFEGGRKRSGRHIELTVEPASPRARDIRMRYSDNGPGLNPSRLSIPEVHRGKPLSQLVFQRGVTSKRDSPGLGLWLTRRVLQTHGGSIDLVDQRNGVTFAIRLPNPA